MKFNCSHLAQKWIYRILFYISRSPKLFSVYALKIEFTVSLLAILDAIEGIFAPNLSKILLIFCSLFRLKSLLITWSVWKKKILSRKLILRSFFWHKTLVLQAITSKMKCIILNLSKMPLFGNANERVHFWGRRVAYCSKSLLQVQVKYCRSCLNRL